MQCPRCRAENRETRRFCGECGCSLSSTCPACGFSNEGSEKFCGGCGKALVPSPTFAEQKFSSPQSYTPRHLAEKILTSKAAFEGERKQVTVLFADLKGSMELLADRDPEEARRLLDPVIEHMMEAVHRYEGTVNQVMGDGIMALFGAPLAHEDHAVRACYAALRMQDAVKRHAEDVFRSQGVLVQIRAGLNSGEVVVRTIGSDLHMDYTAVGQTTHLAARMEQLAAPGTVLLAPAALRLAEGYIEVTSRGPVAIKGLPEPVEVFELTGASAVRSRLQAAAARGFTRFIGRDAEMEQLGRALEQARDASGQLVGVVGGPGLGKSRLFYEFTHSHRTQDWRILASGSVSYGKASSYLPVIDLLKAYFKITDRDSHRDIRAKVTGSLLTLDRALEPAVPPMLALLDVPAEDTQWTALDPQQRRQRTLDGVKHLLLRESHEQPLLVVFEDLHWIDGETQALLDGLVESLPAARMLLLVNYRPEYSHSWGSKTFYTQIRLDALPTEGASELLDVLMGRDATVDPLRSMLAGRTGGNPLFLEETVRGLVETGALAGERGAYRLTQSVETIQVPATVQSILAARIDRLSPEDKRVLQAASVIGKDVPFSLLHAISDHDGADLRGGLTRLQAAEFLYETRLFPDLEYTFKHALTHEVAYGGVLHERRRRLHGHIVGAIETLHSDRLAEHAERLAHHAFRGEEWDKAVRHGRDAARKALGRSANQEAKTYLEQALDALARLPDSRLTREMAVDLRLDLYVTLLPLDQLRPLLQRLREAETLAQGLGDRERLGWARLHLCHVGGLLADDLHPMMELAFDVIEIAQGLGNQRMEADAYHWAGCWAYALGEHRRAVDLLRKGVDARRVRQPGQPTRKVGQSGYVAMFLAELGDFAEAETAAEITMRDPDTTTGHPWNLVNASWMIAWFHGLRGDLDRARGLAEQAVALCRQWGFMRSLGVSMFVLGHVLALAGRATEAVEFLEEGLRRTDSVGMTWLRCVYLSHLAEAYLMAGRVDDSAAYATKAVESARERGEHGFEAWGLRLQAEIALAATPPDVATAEARYRDATALASSLGMRPLLAHCHLGLARLSIRTGEHQEARQHFTIATTMMREMGMRYWLEKAERENKEASI